MTPSSRRTDGRESAAPSGQGHAREALWLSAEAQARRTDGGKEARGPTDRLLWARHTDTGRRRLLRRRWRRSAQLEPRRDRNGIVSRELANKGGCCDRRQLVQVSGTKRVRCGDRNQREECKARSVAVLSWRMIYLILSYRGRGVHQSHVVQSNGNESGRARVA